MMIENPYLGAFEEAAEWASRAEKILRQGGTPMVDYIDSARGSPGLRKRRKREAYHLRE